MDRTTASPGPGPGRRRDRRRVEKAAAVRNAWIRRVSIVLGGALAVVAAWALVGQPGLSLVTGDDPGDASHGRDPRLAALDRKLVAGMPGAGGFSSTEPVVGLGPKGFAPVCGGPAASDQRVLAAASSTLTGRRPGGAVTVVQGRAVYAAGGVGALLAEARRARCADAVRPPPGYPTGSVLLRARGDAGEAYLVSPTSASTALFVTVRSTSAAAVQDTLTTVVPGLVEQARSDAGDLERSIP